MQVIVISDSHGKTNRLQEVEMLYPNANYYIHCGDIEDTIENEKWKIVKGNNDYFLDYPNHLILTLGKHQILVLHGHQFFVMSRHQELANYAKELGCDIVCYGHSHVSCIERIDQILIVNPGSCWRSRDGKGPSYAVLNMKEDQVEAQICFFNK